MSLPLILAHRGANPYPDHSAAAYDHAIDLGADFIEPDLIMTADGVLVSLHDVGDIPSMTYEEVKAAHPDVLTFEEIIALTVARSEETGRNIGIAYEVKDQQVATAQASIDALVEAGFTDPDRVYVNVFNDGLIRTLTQDIMPAAGVDFKTLLLANTVPDLAALAAYADGIALNSNVVNADVVAAAHALGLEVHIWTQAGGVDQFLTFAGYGVDAIYTDNSDIAREGTARLADATLIYGDAEAGESVGGADDDVIYAMQGDDHVWAGAGDDAVWGDGGADLLAGQGGDDALTGGAGDDALLGGAGVNRMEGGRGADVLASEGADTLVFAAGDGVDLAVVNGNDTLRFADLSLADARLSLQDGHLAIEGGAGDAVILKDAARSFWAKPGAVVFADGATLTGAELVAMATAAMDAGVAASIPGLLARLAEAQAAVAAGPSQGPDAVDGDVLAEVDGLRGANLLINGDFEDNSGLSYRDWGWFDEGGDIAGWTDAGGKRLELHADTVGGVSAAQGTFFLDMDGYGNDVALTQNVVGIEDGRDYVISFSIADTDPLEAGETVRVVWNGETIWEAVIEGADWRRIELVAKGGAGDGSGTLSLEHSSGLENLAGLALDDVRMQAVIAPETAPDLLTGTDFVAGVGTDGVQDGAAYALRFTVADAEGDVVKAWWNGAVVGEGAADAGGRSVEVSVEGGAGDGSDTLRFEGLETGATAAVSAASLTQTADATEREDLIVNGGFEDPAGTASRAWGRYNSAGTLTGWTDLNGARVEMHSEPYHNISALEGMHFMEMDGYLRLNEIAQAISGVEEGATYRLRFSIADADLATSDDAIEVRWNGEVIYEDLPANEWKTVSLEVKGGSGDGSDTLIFEQVSEVENYYGVALDAVSLVKIADASTEPETPEWTEVTGTAGRDALVGTDAAELIRGLGGMGDKLTGGGGGDVFDFAGLGSNGARDVATITDYQVGIDALNLAESDVASWRASGGRLLLQLDGGDNDMITVHGVTDLAELTFLL